MGYTNNQPAADETESHKSHQIASRQHNPETPDPRFALMADMLGQITPEQAYRKLQAIRLGQPDTNLIRLNSPNYRKIEDYTRQQVQLQAGMIKLLYGPFGSGKSTLTQIVKSIAEENRALCAIKTATHSARSPISQIHRWSFGNRDWLTRALNRIAETHPGDHLNDPDGEPSHAYETLTPTLKDFVDTFGEAPPGETLTKIVQIAASQRSGSPVIGRIATEYMRALTTWIDSGRKSPLRELNERVTPRGERIRSLLIPEFDRHLCNDLFRMHLTLYRTANLYPLWLLDEFEAYQSLREAAKNDVGDYLRDMVDLICEPTPVGDGESESQAGGLVISTTENGLPLIQKYKALNDRLYNEPSKEFAASDPTWHTADHQPDNWESELVSEYLIGLLGKSADVSDEALTSYKVLSRRIQNTDCLKVINTILNESGMEPRLRLRNLMLQYLDKAGEGEKAFNKLTAKHLESLEFNAQMNQYHDSILEQFFEQDNSREAEAHEEPSSSNPEPQPNPPISSNAAPMAELKNQDASDDKAPRNEKVHLDKPNLPSLSDTPSSVRNFIPQIAKVIQQDIQDSLKGRMKTLSQKAKSADNSEWDHIILQLAATINILENSKIHGGPAPGIINEEHVQLTITEPFRKYVTKSSVHVHDSDKALYGTSRERDAFSLAQRMAGKAWAGNSPELMMQEMKELSVLNLRPTDLYKNRADKDAICQLLEKQRHGEIKQIVLRPLASLFVDDNVLARENVGGHHPDQNPLPDIVRTAININVAESYDYDEHGNEPSGIEIPSSLFALQGIENYIGSTVDIRSIWNDLRAAEQTGMITLSARDTGTRWENQWYDLLNWIGLSTALVSLIGHDRETAHPKSIPREMIRLVRATATPKTCATSICRLIDRWLSGKESRENEHYRKVETLIDDMRSKRVSLQDQATAFRIAFNRALPQAMFGYSKTNQDPISGLETRFLAANLSQNTKNSLNVPWATEIPEPQTLSNLRQLVYGYAFLIGLAPTPDSVDRLCGELLEACASGASPSPNRTGIGYLIKGSFLNGGKPKATRVRNTTLTSFRHH